MFSKDMSDRLRPYRKYNYKIEFLKGKNFASNLGHSALWETSVPQLKFVKKFLKKHFKKGFIKVSFAPCFSSILLAKKPGRKIRFCIDYMKLNKLTKKDVHLLLLIAKTIAWLKKAVIFTKIDI